MSAFLVSVLIVSASAQTISPNGFFPAMPMNAEGNANANADFDLNSVLAGVNAQQVPVNALGNNGQFGNVMGPNGWCLDDNWCKGGQKCVALSGVVKSCKCPPGTTLIESTYQAAHWPTAANGV